MLLNISLNCSAPFCTFQGFILIHYGQDMQRRKQLSDSGGHKQLSGHTYFMLIALVIKLNNTKWTEIRFVMWLCN